MFLGLSPEQLAYSTICGIPMQLLFTYFEFRLLDIPCRRLFWILEFVLIVALSPWREALPAWLRMAEGLAICIFIPFILARDGVLRRVLVCVATVVAMLVFEGFMALEWIALVGMAYTTENLAANLPAAILCAYSMLAAFIIVLLVIRLVRPRLKRGRSFQALRTLLRAEGDPPKPALAPFVLVCVVQLTLELSLCALVSRPQVADNAALCAGMVAVGIVQLVSLMLLHLAMGGYAAKRRADAEAAFVAAHVNDVLQQYEDVTRFVEGAARLRHDFRNQVQLAQIMAEEGDVEGARKQIAEMERMLKAGEGA